MDKACSYTKMFTLMKDFGKMDIQKAMAYKDTINKVQAMLEDLLQELNKVLVRTHGIMEQVSTMDNSAKD